MTSLEFESSPGDPSPKIAELVNAVLRQAPEEQTFETKYPTLHSHSGLVALQKLLPEVPIDALYELRDAISKQDVEPVEEPLAVEPSTLFGRWVKKLRAQLAPVPVEAEPQPPLHTIEILEPIQGWTEQLHRNTPSGRHTVVVRQSSLSGAFMVDGELHELDPQQNIIEVGKVEHTIGERAQDAPYNSVGHRYYTYLPHTQALYASKRYGSDLTDEPLESQKHREKAFKKMLHTLEAVAPAPPVYPEHL